jgi:hypothetical protein
MDSCFFYPLFSLYPPEDHSPEPSHLVEDVLVDNKPEVVGFDEFRAYYSLADSFAFPKTKPAYHS